MILIINIIIIIIVITAVIITMFIIFIAIAFNFYCSSFYHSSYKRNIDKEAKNISKGLALESKMECYAKRPAFITLKDNKEHFKSNQKCRLINLSKSEMGIVSKKYLESSLRGFSATS